MLAELYRGALRAMHDYAEREMYAFACSDIVLRVRAIQSNRYPGPAPLPDRSLVGRAYRLMFN